MRPPRCNNSDLLLINNISTYFGHLYAHRQEIQLRSTAYSCLSCCSCCDAGESVGKMCALCGECCLSLLLHLVGLILTYLLIKDARSFEHKVFFLFPANFLSMCYDRLLFIERYESISSILEEYDVWYDMKRADSSESKQGTVAGCW